MIKDKIRKSTGVDRNRLGVRVRVIRERVEGGKKGGKAKGGREIKTILFELVCKTSRLPSRS